ncbi:Carbonic anhydrase 14 [Bulinus truncatus]|nr:Carbonic anhydrase 14 [Bulinus truncatus]
MVVAILLCLLVTVGVCDLFHLDPIHGRSGTFHDATVGGHEVRNQPQYRRLVSGTSVSLRFSARNGAVDFYRGVSNIFRVVQRKALPVHLDKSRMYQGKSSQRLNLWSYDDTTGSSKVGPMGWHWAFPNCGHRFQSPIDLSYSHFQYRPMAPIVMTSMDYSGLSSVTFSNDGFTATMKPLHKNIYIVCDDLPGKFILSGIHFHWGRTDYSGSEHLLDGHSFPLEMHLVAYNSDYESLQEAEGQNNGVHTVAIFFEVSETHNLGLDFCVDSLKNIQTPGAEYRGPLFNISQLFPPPGLPYYRYLGSLTTPPCTENIIWSIFAVPQVISKQQLDKFRELGLSTEPNPYVGGNVRPLQPLDNRVIFTNDVQFKKAKSGRYAKEDLWALDRSCLTWKAVREAPGEYRLRALDRGDLHLWALDRGGLTNEAVMGAQDEYYL